MYKANVYIDVDGVLRNLSKKIVEVLLDKYYLEITDKFFYEDVQDNVRPLTMDIFTQGDFDKYISKHIKEIYENASPITGAYDLVTWLMDNNFRVFIHTKQLHMKEAAIPTVKWINNYLPYINDIILSASYPKEIFEDDIPSIMVDDSPENFPDRGDIYKIFVSNKGEQRVPQLHLSHTDRLYTVFSTKQIKPAVQGLMEKGII